MGTGLYPTLVNKSLIKLICAFIYCVPIELQKQEWNFGKMRNAVGTQDDRNMFPKLLRVLPHVQECFCDSTKTQRTCYLFCLKKSVLIKKKTCFFYRCH